MIWWKEWRDTRFGFLTAIILVGGLYLSMPPGRQEPDVISLFLGLFVMFFGSVMAIVLGSTAISGEVENNNKCGSNMRVIGNALRRFALDNGEEMPYSLAELYPDYIDDKNFFVCPARGGEFRDFDSDYEYIPGFRIDSPNPDREQLLIERKGNHHAPLEFHNILYLNRHLKMVSD